MEAAKKILVERFESNNSLNSSYFEALGDFGKSIEYNDKDLIEDPHNHTLIVRKSFLLLKNEDFHEANQFLSEMLKFSNFTDQYLLVNYFVSEKKLKGQVKKQKIESKLLDKNPNNKIKAAAYALLGDNNKCFNSIKSILKNDYSYKYIMRDWIVLEEQLKDQKICKLLDCHTSELSIEASVV